MKVRNWIKMLGTVAATAALVFVLVGCGGTKSSGGDTSQAQSGTITIEGSDTLINLAQAWAESYMGSNSGVAITVKGGGSGVGIVSLVNGTVDFADASRKMKAEEIAADKSAGRTPKETAVARDGIAVIVNSANSVKGLSTDQLGKIYRGETTNWKEVGGKDAPIVLLGRDTSSGTYEFFSTAVVGANAKYAKSMRSMQSNQSIVDEVKGNANAIGYVGMGYENPAISVLEVDGKAATVAAVKDGSYTLSRDLYMYSNGAPTGAAKKYLDWILSDAGQKIVQQEGFVALGK
ncbi:MAG: PstS family phosphate ABC transporter substrate-binding protein [Coriobacteriia bacterium]|nr:PstS family phosphate ABC transporter substrate-binding protein [Coriobacteriia bacterium]